LEVFVEFLFHRDAPQAFNHHIAAEFSWNKLIAIHVWVLVLFLIYTTAVEVNGLLGAGELFKILFKRRSAALKAGTAPADPRSREARSPAHAELVALL